MAKKIHIIEVTDLAEHKHTVHDASDPMFHQEPGGRTIKEAIEYYNSLQPGTRKLKDLKKRKKKEAGDAS